MRRPAPYRNFRNPLGFLCLYENNSPQECYHCLTGNGSSLLPPITQAAKPSPSPSVATTTGKQAPESADQRLADLKTQVNLTKAQEAKVKPIVEKYVSDRNALKSDTTASKTDKNSKKEALRKQYNSDINAVLTPDQQQKWAAAKKEMFQPKQAAAASPSPSAKKK